jgi:hypothetical protein
MNPDEEQEEWNSRMTGTDVHAMEASATCASPGLWASIFDCLRRIMIDKCAASNEALAGFARDQDTSTTGSFLVDTARKRTPTDKPLITRIGLSQRIIGRCIRARNP